MASALDGLRTDPGTVKPGGKVHAVEHDSLEYSAWALCGASCSDVDRTSRFNPLDERACRKCATAVWRVTGPWKAL